MTDTNLRKKLIAIFDALQIAYGPQICPLTHSSSLQLLVSVILSAQCTDKKVNAVTPSLFKKFPDAKSFARADISELEDIIRPIGLFRAKSANIVATCKKIESDFSGSVPKTMKELTSLSGVGRKTANVILGNAFNVPGFPVDTHVIRLMNRIGIVKNKIPEKIEAVVNKNLPAKYWTDFSHLLITHGRNRCKAAKPDCENCEIRKLCKTAKTDFGR
jgi:endonuclease III